MIWQRIILSGLLITGFILPQDTLPDIGDIRELDQLLNQPFFDTCVVGIQVSDLVKNTILYSRNNHLLLHPASNTKLYTSAAALVFLGPGYQFTTGVYYDGTIKKGVLKGNLYFRGGGDPDFTHHEFDTVIAELKKKGIRKITGCIFADVSLFDSLYWGKGWMWDDDPSTDAPYLTPLSINKNCLKVTVTAPERGSKCLVSIEPPNPQVNIRNECSVETGTTSSVSINRNWFNRNNEIIITGVMNRGSKPVTKTVNVIDPSLHFLQVFKGLAQKAGIRCVGMAAKKDIPGKSISLVEIKRDINAVLKTLNKNSDNLSAELTLRVLAAERLRRRHIDTDTSLKYLDTLILLTGSNKEHYRLVDGSGVSHYNLVSPFLTDALLRYMCTNNNLCESYRATLPIGGVDGTLQKRMHGLGVQGNVFAKTGTLSGVSCLSGYLSTRSGRWLSFSIMMQNYVGRLSFAQLLQDKICDLLYREY